jgi:hypothetical protein
VRRLDVDRRLAPSAYRHRLVLVRADQHVAWRGDAVPADAEALVERLCGRLGAPATASAPSPR